MINPRRNKEMKAIWFEIENKEKKRLKDALDSNNKEEVLDIIFRIYLRHDFEL